MKVRIKDAGNKWNGTAKVAIECILLQAKSEHIGVEFDGGEHLPGAVQRAFFV